MELGPRLGSGQTADVLAIDSDRVLKRFKPGTPFEVAQREAENTRIANEAGLPVPNVHDVTSQEGRPAIIYDRIDGPSMLSDLVSRPWTLHRHARTLAELHASIHAVQPADGRSHRQRLAQDIEEAPRLSPRMRRRIRTRLEDLATGQSVCHGDFHPENVVVTDDGPVIIDWLDAGLGHPASDVARTSVILRFAGRARGPGLWLLLAVFRLIYLHYYHRESPMSRDVVHDWELPIAAARLTEDVPAETELRSFIESRLGE